MPKPCSVCVHANADIINAKLVEGVTLETLSKAYKLSVTALHRHKQQHIPPALAKAQEAQEVAAADSLMGRIAALNAKAEDIYSRAIEADNLNAAIGAVRELRGVTELYARITGELQAQNVTNIIVSPEWTHLRTVIFYALDTYPEAKQAVAEAVRGIEG